MMSLISFVLREFERNQCPFVPDCFAHKDYTNSGFAVTATST
jgi:hypothetical protein